MCSHDEPSAIKRKTNLKKPVFGHFRKSQRAKFATKYLKSTTKQY